ncbi:MAG TPA: lipopolysaccharide biosynthesis protein [Chryseolinea sp.]|nr:lipopolysaccharide biosynthesis protein [Chryseolinea sp.]
MASFFHALKWSAAGEIASKAIQPVIFIFLARLLTPDDYGIMAAALMVISFTQVFWDAGMGKALIQRQTDEIDAANAAFWINLTLGLVLSVLLFFTASILAERLFHDNRITPVLQAMTLQIILGSLSSIPTSLLQKQMKFNSLFWVRLLSIGVPGIFSIPLAYFGMSYWALVVGTLVGQLMQVILLYGVVDWRPALTFNKAIAKELGKFAFWVGATGLLVWFFLWADSFIIGAYLGTHELGLFRTGNMFVIMIYDGVLFGPLLPVLYSYISKFYSDTEKVKSSAIKIIRIIAIVGIPSCIILFSLADPVSNIIFGEKWTGVAFVIGMMALMRGYGWLVAVNSEIYRAVGKPQVETAVLGISFLFFLPVYLISVTKGFETFIIARLALGLFSLIPHFLLFNRLFKISLLPIVRTATICTICSLIVFAIDFPVAKFLPQDILHVLVTGSISILVIGALILTLERKFVRGLLNEFKERK